ncbi:unnamed protein product [Macrosiphum euphorbiae]|uniref:CCHC-type domain-containing protein n=1 Tax=Macrosiphum euphorbiae TaxID=13131 RepID=A0AAV0X7R3_9HEMI|nr:unnamed protein product [Macrosiphum euphorbiae]
MGDKPISTNDMNNTNSPSQHTLNNQTFAEIASNTTLPKMNQAIVFNSINNIKQIEYVSAISKIVPAENIIFVSRISNNRFCVFFNSQTVMENLLKTHSSIHVNGIDIPIRRLINASKRIILSNVYPTIPNQLILNALHQLGIKTTSQITHMKAGFATEQFSHILSFRRQIYINQDSATKLPNSITVTVENTTFRIFITDDIVTCFQCHQTGHFSSQCKNIPDPINVINETETVTETLIDLSSTTIEDNNLSSSLPIVSTQNYHNTQDSESVLLDQVVDKDIITSYEQPNKPSLIDKLKLTANHRTKVPPLQPAKRPAPSTSSASQPPSPKSFQPSSPPPQSTMKPPGSNTLDGRTQQSKNPKGSVSKKLKVRTNSISSDTVHTNIDECFDSTRDLFDTHLDFSLTFDQFRDFFESSKGCSDLENLCNKYACSPDDILEIISTIYPNVTVKSAKNRLTRLSNALKKIIQDFNACQNADPDGDDDETF